MAARLMEAARQGPPSEPAVERLRRAMLDILEGEGRLREKDANPGTKPQVWLIVGVNGSGKTTTVGRLAWRFKNQGQEVMLAAADTYRAAAGEQLAQWADRVGAELIGAKPGADPAAVAFDAVAAAQSRGSDILLIDTAGRLHNKKHLQDELGKIGRTISKKLPEAPHTTLLVMDATTGQSGLAQARLFSESVKIDGLVLTKFDGTAKGGIVLAIRQELGIPVRWVGVGEGPQDLIEFQAGEFVSGLLGQE